MTNRLKNMDFLFNPKSIAFVGATDDMGKWGFIIFNNILSGIFGYSQLAETHLHHPEKARDYIRKIFNGAQRASMLIQQILTFSRHSDYDRKPLSVYVPLKEALKMLRSTIPTNIEIREKI